MQNTNARVDDAAAIYVNVDKLLPWVKNPRKNDMAVAGVAKSIELFGFGAPVLARRANGEIIAGHTRIKAAAQLGMATVPVRYLDLDEKQAHKLALADNRLGEVATWDDELLAEVLSEFDGDDLSSLGFGDAELEVLLPKHENVTPPNADGEGPGEFLDAGIELIRVRVAIAEGQRVRDIIARALESESVSFRLE
jgi:site-specific DNA-methyltransferase (adenine-specific)